MSYIDTDRCINLLDDETIDTTIEVDVDELCTTTVANSPSISPAMGFERTAPSLKALPVILPASKTDMRGKHRPKVEHLFYLRPIGKPNS